MQDGIKNITIDTNATIHVHHAFQISSQCLVVHARGTNVGVRNAPNPYHIVVRFDLKFTLQVDHDSLNFESVAEIFQSYPHFVQIVVTIC